MRYLRKQQHLSPLDELDQGQETSATFREILDAMWLFNANLNERFPHSTRSRRGKKAEFSRWLSDHIARKTSLVFPRGMIRTRMAAVKRKVETSFPSRTNAERVCAEKSCSKTSGNHAQTKRF